MLSSFFSFIPTEWCMEFKREDFTRGTHPHFPLTIGLVRQKWSDREAGQFSNSSSSTHRESCTASKGAGFIKRHPPRDVSDNWLATTHLIGVGGWSGFRFLFFLSDGDLYGVYNGKFYKRSPPVRGRDNWLGSSTMIGSGGWSVFKFLMSPLG